MTTFVAPLRGVNLGNRNKIAMPALRQLFEGLGYEHVKTYVQSGNVAFKTKGAKPAPVRAKIEKAITDELGLTVTVLLRTGKQLDGVIASNPFGADEDDPTKLLVTFLAQSPPAKRVSELDPDAGGATARFAVQGLEVYLHCPNGYGRSKLDNAFFEKRLGVAATTRNWRTVLQLAELAGG